MRDRPHVRLSVFVSSFLTLAADTSLAQGPRCDDDALMRCAFGERMNQRNGVAASPEVAETCARVRATCDAAANANKEAAAKAREAHRAWLCAPKTEETCRQLTVTREAACAGVDPESMAAVGLCTGASEAAADCWRTIRGLDPCPP